MPAPDVLRADALRLGDVEYTLDGGVELRLISVFPGKVVSGDPTRDDEQLASSHSVSNWRGGLGVRRGDATSTGDRMWDSTLDTRYDGLRLWPRAQGSQIPGYPQSADGTVPSRVQAISAGEIPQLVGGTNPTNRLYVSFWDPSAGGSMHLRRWEDATPQWVNPFNGAPALGIPAETSYTFTGSVWNTPLTGVAGVWMSSAYWLVWSSQAGLVIYNPTGAAWTFQVGDAADGDPAPPLDHLIFHDDKLWGLDRIRNRFWQCATIALPWTRLGDLPVPPYHATKLLVLPNDDGEPTIHAVTRGGPLFGGVWAYDPIKDGWLRTTLDYPQQLNSGEGVVRYRNETYISTGPSVLHWVGNTVSPMGLDRGDGLPPEVRGTVRRLCGIGQNWIAAGTDSSGTTNPYAYAAVFLWDGQGWHSIWRSPYPGTLVEWLHHSVSDGKSRLWIGVWGTLAGATDVIRIDMPAGFFNPLDVTTTEYAESGYLVGPWFNANWAELEKLLDRVKARAQQASPTAPISIDLGFEGNEHDWHTVGRWEAPVYTAIPLPSWEHPAGEVEREVRIRIRMARGADVTETPVLRFVTLAYLKLLDPLFGYACTIVAGPEEGTAQMASLMAALQARTKLACQFWRRGVPLGNLSATPPKQVRITSFAARIRSGDEDQFRADLALTEI